MATAAKRAKHSDDTLFENQINLEKLHLNSQWSDVKFLFDSGNGTKSIPANKAVLAAQSDVFAAMFYGGLKENGDIKVTDASIDGFKEFLQFFYLNHVELTMENVAEVMNLGHKYNVTNCVDVCVQFLKNGLNKDKVCFGLSLATLYEQQELKKCCEEYIKNHSVEVFKSKSFLECDKRVLALILKSESFSCSETVIFEACLSWVKAKSKQSEMTKQLIQEQLGELFYEIRFVSMTIKEFGALSMAHKYAFSFDEYQDIVHTIASPEVSSKLFNGNPRKMLWNDRAVIVCDRKIAGSAVKWWSKSKNKPTTFESNQPMVLGTLVFAPMCARRNGQFGDLESDLPIDVTIIERATLNKDDDGSIRTLSKFKINLPSKMQTSITLPVPVSVRTGFYYEIQLDPQQSTDDYHYKCATLMADVQMENEWNIKFYGDRTNNNSELVNLISGLGFNRI